MLEEIDLFRLAGSRMRYLTERQSVVARNIANADTPGYRAQDLTPFSFDSLLLRGGSPAGAAAPLALARTSEPREPGIAVPQLVVPARPAWYRRAIPAAALAHRCR